VLAIDSSICSLASDIIAFDSEENSIDEDGSGLLLIATVVLRHVVNDDTGLQTERKAAITKIILLFVYCHIVSSSLPQYGD